MKSTSSRYGNVAVTIHWASAALIIAMLGSGFRATSLVDSTAKATILTAHVSMGVIILLLTLARIAWWLFADKKPKAPAGDPAWQTASAKAVHILFYIVILGMAASGIGMMILSGAGSIIFGGNGVNLPNFTEFLPRGPHGIGARLMLVLFALHVGAAFFHHFVKKDGLILRMWYGSE